MWTDLKKKTAPQYNSNSLNCKKNQEKANNSPSYRCAAITKLLLVDDRTCPRQSTTGQQKSFKFGSQIASEISFDLNYFRRICFHFLTVNGVRRIVWRTLKPSLGVFFLRLDWMIDNRWRQNSVTSNVEGNNGKLNVVQESVKAAERASWELRELKEQAERSKPSAEAVFRNEHSKMIGKWSLTRKLMSTKMSMLWSSSNI